jgi:hypothetical protein
MDKEKMLRDIYTPGGRSELLNFNSLSHTNEKKKVIITSNPNSERKPNDKLIINNNNNNNKEKEKEKEGKEGINNNNEPKNTTKNETDKNSKNTPNKNDDYNEYINNVLSSKKTKLITNYQYVSLENKIGENSCFVNVIIHFLYLFPCVNDYLIRRYQNKIKKIEIESKTKEEIKKEKTENDEQNKNNQKEKEQEQNQNQNQINDPKNSNNPKENKDQKENKENKKAESMTGSNEKTPKKETKGKIIKLAKKKGDPEEFLFQLGKILNDYQNVLSNADNKKNITQLNSINLRKSLSITNNSFKLNSISDPVEFLIYILDIINDKNSKEIHTHFHLKLIEEKRCTNFCPYKSNKQYDKDNFIYQIYVEEILDYIKSHKFDFDEYKEKLFMLSYYSSQNEIMKCEKCNSPMNKTIICNNEQGFPKFLLINCVWNNFKPDIQDVITFLYLISLIEELDNLFLCPNKPNQDNYHLKGIIFYSFTLCHYINMIFNLQENVFTLYNDEGIIEFKTLNDLYRYLTLEQLQNNNQAYFYPVLLVYGKENIYDGNYLNLIKRINKNNFEQLKEECKIEIKKNKEKNEKPLTEEEKQKNYKELLMAQLKLDKENNNYIGKNKDNTDYYKILSNYKETNKINIINDQNKKTTINNNFLKGNNRKTTKPYSMNKNNFNYNRNTHLDRQINNNELNRILRNYDYLGDVSSNRFDNNYTPSYPYNWRRY